MFVLYNNQLIAEHELHLPLSDRAFQYNDGFFETAMVVNGRIRFWEQHQQRMKEAAAALHLELPEHIFKPDFEEKLLQLAQHEKAVEYGRLKLKVWRAGEGLYTPEINQVNWLASIKPAPPAPLQPLHIGICQQVNTAYTSVSHFKGPNAPLYVLAGLEKQAQQKDDMLLLNRYGMMAELISSNIFWMKDETLYTPDLSVGCVNGILRRNIIRWCSKHHLEVKLALREAKYLLQADAAFSANVTGIRAIASMNGEQLQQKAEFLQLLRKELDI